MVNGFLYTWLLIILFVLAGKYGFLTIAGIIAAPFILAILVGILQASKE